jgi:ComF family protein
VLKQIRAAVLFAEPVSVVIHKMKYEGLFGLAEPLADLMTSAWGKWQSPVDLILPIPLHPDREKKRGYNQSNLLAKHLGSNLNLDVDFKVIHRNRHTPPQVGLTAKERLSNVSGAFVVLSQKAIGKDVLLIDDVCTTGATMSAAAQVLLDAGASSVAGYCVARAV